jgi:hypothetical protein
MPLRRPLPLLRTDRLRRIPASFAWLDHRLRAEGHLAKMGPADLGLYFFLVLAADRQGLSCWRLDRMIQDLPFSREDLIRARSRLTEWDLLAYRPWSKGSPDGVYQVLDCPRGPMRNAHLGKPETIGAILQEANLLGGILRGQTKSRSKDTQG